MKTKSMLFATLLLSAIWVAAQTQPSSTSPSGPSSDQQGGTTAGSQTSTPSTAPQQPTTTPQTPDTAPQAPGAQEQGTPGAGTPDQNAAPSHDSTSGNTGANATTGGAAMSG